METSHPKCVVEVEVGGHRGFEEDEEDVEYQLEVSLELISSQTGESLGRKQWGSLGSTRRRTFVGHRGRDRFALACREDSNPLVRLEVFKREESKQSSSLFDLLSSTSKAAEAVGSTEIAPWVEVGDGEGYRWVRLGAPREQKKRVRRPSRSAIVDRRRELRISAICTHSGESSSSSSAQGEAVAAAERVHVWFREPARRRSDLGANVARVAIVRAAGLPAGAYFVGARADSGGHKAAAMEFRPGRPRPKYLVSDTPSTSRIVEDSVWMQTLTLALDDLENQDSCRVEIAVLKASSATKSPCDVESTKVVVAARGIVERNRGDDAVAWHNLGNGVSLRLAVKLDYDELLDPAESRPFFPVEFYPSLVRAPVSLQKPNALRVVVARCRDVEIKSRKPQAVRCVVSVDGTAKKTLAKVPAMNGVVIFNECFEFPNTGDPIVTLGGVQVEVEAPDRRVHRQWYEFPGVCSVLIAATRCRDDTVTEFDERAANAEHLALAFPDVPRRDLERVLDSTKTLFQACVALGALGGGGEAKQQHEDDEVADCDIVAASNATDLAWVRGAAAAAAHDDGEDSDGGVEAKEDLGEEEKRKSAVRRNKPPLFRVGMGASHLSEKQTIDLVKRFPIARFKSTYEFKDPAKPALELDDEPLGLTVLIDVQNDGLHSNDDASQGSSISDVPTDLLSNFSKHRRLVVVVRTEFDARVVMDDEALKRRFDHKRLFDLDRVYLDVKRTPRDFVTLRTGLLNRLRGLKRGDSNYLPKQSLYDHDDELPPLPAWVKRALNMKARTQRTSVAAAATGAAVAAAVAFATGFAPVLAVSGALAAGTAAFAGAMKTTKSSLLRKIDADLAKCDFLEALRRNLANRSPSSRVEEAHIFLKLFLAHGSKLAMFQKVHRKSNLDPDLLKAMAQEEQHDEQLLVLRSSTSDIRDEARRRSLTRPQRPAPPPPGSTAVV